jgi:hypothetical protein
MGWQYGLVTFASPFFVIDQIIEYRIMKIKQLFVIGLAAIPACKDDPKLQQKKYPYTLNETRVISFPLDSTQGFYYNCVRYDDSTNTFQLFNEINRTIYTYDYDKTTLVSKDTLQKEGPDGVGPANRGGFLIKNDTTYFLNYHTGQLCILKKGKLIKKLDLYPKVFESEGFAEGPTLYPLQKRGNNLDIITQSIDPREDNTKLNSLITVNLETSEVVRSVKRPAFYNRGYWGMLNPYKVYYAFNNKRSNYVFSFCADPQLHVYDTGHTEIKTIEIETDYFSNSDIKPVEGVSAKEGLNFLNNQKEKAQMHDFITPSFGPLFYDPYNDVYYRFANHPLTKKEYKDPQMFEKYPMEFSIVILNNEFKKIGEYVLPRKGFFTGMMLITKDGLLIGKSSEYKKNEDKLPFAVFKLIKNETDQN